MNFSTAEALTTGRSLCCDASGDQMYFLLNAVQRKERGGTLYLEFQPGPYRGQHWQEDALFLPAPLFDDLGLHDLFAGAIPKFDYYYYTEVDDAQFRALYALAQEHHTQCAGELLAELAPHAEKWLEEYGCFTICGI